MANPWRQLWWRGFSGRVHRLDEPVRRSGRESSGDGGGEWRYADGRGVCLAIAQGVVRVGKWTKRTRKAARRV